MANNLVSVAKFGIRVTEKIKKAVHTYIDDAITERYGNVIPKNVQFLLSNGDIVEGVYIASKRCFIGLEKLFQRYHKHDICHLFVEYIGEGSFLVYLFDSSAVEIEYRINPVLVTRKEVDSDKVPTPNLYNFRSVMNIQGSLTNSLLTFNTHDSNCRKICIYMPEQKIYSLQPLVRLDNLDEGISCDRRSGSMLSLHAGKMNFFVMVQKLSKFWYLIRGWPAFVKALDVGESDMVVLSTS